MQKPTEFELIKDTYITNHDHYISIVGCYIASRNYWRFIAILALLLTTFALGSTIYFAKKAKTVKTLVFKEDGSGGLTFIGIPNTPLEINKKALIANQLIQFINALYNVPQSRPQKQYNVALLISMTSPTYFENTILPILKHNYLQYNEQSIYIHINSVAPTKYNVWEIEFDMFNTKQVKISSFKSMITYQQDLNLEDSEILKNNPLGLYITNIDTITKFKNYE